MKKFFLQFRTPIVLLVALVLCFWLFFPYLFSGKEWKVEEKFRVTKTDWTSELVGSSNDFPDTRIVYLLYGEDNVARNLIYPLDILDNSKIAVGDFVYVYELREGRACVSRCPAIDDYGLRWHYYWNCDVSPIKNAIVFLLFVAFCSTLALAILRN